MERLRRPTVEEVIRDAMEDEVPISYIMNRTGLSEYDADQRMRSLHREGVITYFPEIFPCSEKKAVWNNPHEEPED